MKTTKCFRFVKALFSNIIKSNNYMLYSKSLSVLFGS